MSPAVVALLVSSLLCQQPAMNFREFYAKLNAMPMLGANGEIVSDAVRREMNAAADFLDYRAARMEKCR
jgi:hypothetical protein